MKKPYWTHKGCEFKFRSLAAVTEAAATIEKMGFDNPPITYHRMLGAIWVTTTIEKSTAQ